LTPHPGATRSARAIHAPGGMKAGLPLASAIFGVFLFLGTASCGEESQKEYPVSLADGEYRVVFGRGYEAADEARILAVTARLDRSANQIVFTLADGSHQVLVFSPRPRSQWQPDCFTLSSHSLDEVADLSPAPLRLESLTFLTPVVYAKCTTGRMILADDAGPGSTPFLALDLTPLPLDTAPRNRY
jgi:hypothetical protein